ncbi:MAG: hypothetical protein SYNGOMJ08_00683 [Candidatus Syntrophoarchaeum sp. GoM_oil]|nr:MAG: hypothetical protein SYNGOMJ08_00683 [Candidatus Syntrophoarchaeum sp. GoM_oil]
MDETIKVPKVVFFLGAGASVAADVPATEDFIYGNEGFKKHIEDKGFEEEKIVLQEILTVLKKKKDEIDRKYQKLVRQNKDKEKSDEFEGIKREKEKFEKIDVELVLETLYKLNNKEVELLPDFYDQNTFKFTEKEESLKSLEKKLRGFIREKTIVSEDKIDYLAPLKEFVAKYEMLDIFSVNYDTCIEQFCKEYGLRYTDGFELYWHPESFDDSDYDVKLYKIHGSVMWYLTDRGSHVKIPIASGEKDEIKLITGETAKTLMVYPMGGKWEYAEPLLELIRRLHVGLEKAEVCIVIGYSFRDDYIRRIFFEAARTNKDLILFLIAPDAGRIYDDKLKFIDKDKIRPSSLEGKVICWNYPMEIVLKDYYLYRSLGKLSDILKGLEKAQEFKRERGSKVGAFQYGLQEVVLNCIEIGYTSMAEKVLEKEEGITVDNLKESHLFVDRDRRYIDKLRILCGLGVNHLYSGNYVRAKRYFTELKEILEQSLSVGNEYFELNSRLITYKKEREEGKRIKNKIEEIKKNNEVLPYYTWFMCSSSDSRWVGCLQDDFIDLLNKEIKLRSIDDDISKLLSKIIEKCNQMKAYLEIPSKTGIYEESDEIDIENPLVEIARKDDAEEKLKEIIKAFEGLIGFCEKKEGETT